MGRPELLLHVGTHKTGTTALQVHLAEHRALLARQHIFYPSLRHGLWRDNIAHHRLAEALASNGALDRLRLALYRRWLDRHSSYDCCVVLSAESVYRHRIGAPCDSGTAAWFAGHRAYLARVADYLSRFRTRAVIYLRQPEDFAISLYKEHVVRRADGKVHPNLGNFVKAHAAFFDYPAHIEALSATLDTVLTRSYEAARRNGGIEEDFLELIGRPILPPPTCVSVRASPNNRGTLWLARQPATLGRIGYQRRVLFAVRVAAEGPFAEPECTTLWPDRATFKAFVAKYQHSYAVAGLTPPSCEKSASTQWTTADHAAAEAAFRDWETANMPLLRKREIRHLRFFDADPS